MGNAFRRYVRYPAEAAAAYLCFGFFRLLRPRTASALGGWLGRTIGPRLRVSDIAERNLDLAMPGTTRAEKARIIRGVWDNLGRVVAEYPHLECITGVRGDPSIEVVGREHLDCITDEAGGGILVSGHFANWEVFALTMVRFGMPCAQVYRMANNPIVDRMVVRARRLGPELIMPKGSAGARKAIEILQRGGRVGMLIDQKLNDGIALPFFGHEAMTPSAPAQLALRFGRPIVAAWIERLGGCRFRIVVDPPFTPRRTGDRRGDIRALTTALNRFLEQRIRERPEQWLWLHRRWPKEAFAAIRSAPASGRQEAGGRAAPDTD